MEADLGLGWLQAGQRVAAHHPFDNLLWLSVVGLVPQGDLGGLCSRSRMNDSVGSGPESQGRNPGKKADRQ